MSRTHIKNAHQQAGFGLIELMIALALGVMVMGAAFAVFQSNQRSYQANQGLSRIQENARVAFQLMARDLRAAGGGACSSAASVETTSAESNLYKDASISGSSSEFTVTAGDDTSYKVTDASATSSTFELPAGTTDATDVVRVNDWLLLCNARKIFVVQATAVSTGTGTGTVTYDALPGNYDPDADKYAPPAAVVVSKLRSTRWYLDGSTLRVSRFGGAGEAVADGVSALQVSYLQNGAASYVSAPTSWPDVIAVRTNLTLTGRDVDGAGLQRVTSNVVSLRGRTL